MLFLLFLKDKLYSKIFSKKLLSKKVKHVIIYLRSKKVKENLTLKYKLDGHRPKKKDKGDLQWILIVLQTV